MDVYVNIDSSGADDVVISVNKPLAEAYVNALSRLSADFDMTNDLTVTALSRMPDVLKVEKQEADLAALEADISTILDEALTGFDSMRLREGEKLYQDISARLEEIGRLTDLAEQRSPKTVSEYRSKLEQRMAEVLQNTDIDETFILTEAAIFADRTVVNEEIVRLRSHLSQLGGMLQSSEPVGRKLDFLIQECNREANTIGSKGNDLEMARIVVDLKAEIEKIREQAQNIE